ncbi:MAG: bifunctional 4-hydroxy-2-oxoglutarate aldolase/2-dehydro-3-deoxy-phosphogluconate aldolase [Vampirovibrionales bacterium]|nr:bifunctional 4-hydroxy-2-oxoglutarate aldolase/2-dehydro-3-deoxy-phosphogluconate aldolase [Vampirovibrionales bacterium]
MSLSFDAQRHQEDIQKNLVKTLRIFRKERLMAVIRTDDAEDAIWGGRLLLESGFRILDITYGIPDTERVIETLANEFPKALIGAGTVLTPRQALGALSAGASFLASPVLDQDMLAFGTEYKLLILPGVSTPTEMANAMHWGAHALKFFPAEHFGGADFIKTVLAPLPDLPIVATGGISVDRMADYWQAGAMAVGIGNYLLPTEALKSRDEGLIAKRAKSALGKRDAFFSAD